MYIKYYTRKFINLQGEKYIFILGTVRTEMLSGGSDLRKHPSKSIIATKSKKLEGKLIVLCITGSVSAVRSPEIARELMRNAAEVYVVMSQIMMRRLVKIQLTLNTINHH